MAKIDHKKVAQLIESNQKENLILAAEILIGASKCHKNYYENATKWQKQLNEWSAIANNLEHDRSVARFIIKNSNLSDIIWKEKIKHKVPRRIPTKLNHALECRAIDILVVSEVPNFTLTEYSLSDILKLYPPNDPTTLQVIEQIKNKYQR